MALGSEERAWKKRDFFLAAGGLLVALVTGVSGLVFSLLNWADQKDLKDFQQAVEERQASRRCAAPDRPGTQCRRGARSHRWSQRP